MTTLVRRPGRSRLLRLGPVALLVACLLSACAASAASPATPEPATPGTAPSDAPVGSGAVGGGEGSEPGGPDGDAERPGRPGPGGPGTGGAFPGQPRLVVPRPGQRLVHPVGLSRLVARVEGTRVLVNAHWWSGIEPCAVLDSVDVTRDGYSFTITLREGTSDPDRMCIAIALEKVTVVDLGDLPAGSYQVRASSGDAPAIPVVVP